MFLDNIAINNYQIDEKCNGCFYGGGGGSESTTKQDQSSHVTTTTTTEIGDIGLTGKDFVAGFELLETGFEKVVDAQTEISAGNFALTKDIIESVAFVKQNVEDGNQPVILSQKELQKDIEKFTPLILASIGVAIALVAFKTKGIR